MGRVGLSSLLKELAVEFVSGLLGWGLGGGLRFAGRLRGCSGWARFPVLRLICGGSFLLAYLMGTFAFCFITA